MAGEDGVSSPTVEPGGSELVSVDRVVDHDVVGMVAEAGAGRQVSATEQPASSLRAVTRGSGRPDDDGTADLPDALFLLALVGVLGLVLVGWLVGLKVILDRRHGHARPAEGEISRSRRSAP